MYKKIICLTFLCLGFFGFTQNQKERDFEKNIYEFRLGLYEELNKIDSKRLLRFELSHQDSIVILLSDFHKENEKEIRNYKEGLLKAEEGRYTFNLDAYYKVPDTLLKEALAKKAFSRDFINYADILFVSPYDEVDFYTSFLFPSILDKSSYTKFIRNIKERIIPGLISTKQINEYTWEIIDNRYDFINKFIYDIKEGKIVDYTAYILKEKFYKDE